MTLFAGVYSYGLFTQVNNGICFELSKALSRRKNDTRYEYRDDFCYLVKIDIGAYNEPAFQRNADETIALLVGEPLLSDRKSTSHVNRGADLERIHSSWLANDMEALKLSQGTFASVHYSPERNCLAIATDKLAVRPVYIWHGPGIVVFASALRVLEEVQSIPKSMDARGAAEIMAYRFPMGRRTQYQSIDCLEAGEILEITRDGPRSKFYWRWDNLKQQTLSRAIDEKYVYRKFKDAVARRIHPGEKSVNCLLSGGLDSRCVASELVKQKKFLYTFNLSDIGTFDQVFSQQIATKLGARHHAKNTIVEPFEHPITSLAPEILRIDSHESGLRVRFESHVDLAIRRTRSMTEAA